MRKKRPVLRVRSLGLEVEPASASNPTRVETRAVRSTRRPWDARFVVFQ